MTRKGRRILGRPLSWDLGQSAMWRALGDLELLDYGVCSKGGG